MRKCFYCKIEKPLDEFVRAPRNKEDQKGYFCEECMKIMRQTLPESRIGILKTQAWRYNNPERYRQLTAQINLKQTLKRFGLDSVQYYTILERQNNRCPICDGTFDENDPPIIEHDHKTGKFRALTHQSCNMLIAHVENNPREWIINAMEHIDSRKEQTT